MKKSVMIILCFLFIFCCITVGASITTEKKKEIKDLILQYIDEKDTAKREDVLKKIQGFKDVTFPEYEEIIRGSRDYAPAEKTGVIEKDLQCVHVNHKEMYFLYIPETYDPKKPAPLIVVFMGGSWDWPMEPGYYTNFLDPQKRKVYLPGARKCAQDYFNAWLEEAKKSGLIVVAPSCTKGWGFIGNSITFSAIWEVSKNYNIDPDRIYGWGQSMGGHASWRIALHSPDRFAGVSPVCGGYDYKDVIKIVNNIAIYHVWGERDPHSAGLNTIGAKNASYLKELGYDAVNVPRLGGHELFPDEIPNIWKYFSERPRKMYSKHVIALASEWPLVVDRPDTGSHVYTENGWKGTDFTWTEPIPFGRFYWIEILEKVVVEQEVKNPVTGQMQVKQKPALVEAEIKEGNKIEIKTDNVKKFKIYLHDKLVDMSKPVEVIVNGKSVFNKKVEKNLKTMLEDVRIYRDRGRIFYGAIEVEVPEESKKEEKK